MLPGGGQAKGWGETGVSAGVSTEAFAACCMRIDAQIAANLAVSPGQLNWQLSLSDGCSLEALILLLSLFVEECLQAS